MNCLDNREVKKGSTGGEKPSSIGTYNTQSRNSSCTGSGTQDRTSWQHSDFFMGWWLKKLESQRVRKKVLLREMEVYILWENNPRTERQNRSEVSEWAIWLVLTLTSCEPYTTLANQCSHTVPSYWLSPRRIVQDEILMFATSFSPQYSPGVDLNYMRQ